MSKAVDSAVAEDIDAWERRLPPVWRAWERAIGDSPAPPTALDASNELAAATVAWMGALGLLSVAWLNPASWLVVGDAFARLEAAWLPPLGASGHRTRIPAQFASSTP